jgi:hypothetical protein
MHVGTHLTNQQMCVGTHIANLCQQESEIRKVICIHSARTLYTLEIMSRT